MTSYSWSSPAVPAAIGISIGAGLATGLGGSLVFFPTAMAKISQRQILGISLALSAGVMLYVSFIEIYAKSLDGIIESGLEQGPAVAVTTACFFAGMFICILLEVIVNKISARGMLKHEDICPAHIHSPPGGELRGDDCRDENLDIKISNDIEESALPSTTLPVVKPPASSPIEHGHGFSEEDQGKLARMGMMTALAIAIHNFPEGLATFLAAVSDVNVGASLGVAIAIHNIPEGVCVAMPIFYATKNKWKAFGWSLVSGITEPIGGILGFAVLQSVFTDLVFGIVFAMVGGMMVFIVCHELLPAAHQYLGNSAKATGWLILGMVIMAVSLVLFVF